MTYKNISISEEDYELIGHYSEQLNIPRTQVIKRLIKLASNGKSVDSPKVESEKVSQYTVLRDFLSLSEKDQTMIKGAMEQMRIDSHMKEAILSRIKQRESK